MQPEVGKIYDGKVTGITNFGAFVELEPNVTGMVHISEVANTFVSEIRDHLTVGQEVKVKVLSVSDEGKISLSIKKASEAPQQRSDFKRGPQGGRRGNQPGNGGPNRNRPKGDNPRFAQGQPEKAPLTKEAAFEDMMNKFKQSSDEKMSDIKKNMDSKRRNTSRKRG